MGFTPSEVNEMGLWEFHACVQGYAKAHGAKGPSSGGDISEERLRELGIKGF